MSIDVTTAPVLGFIVPLDDVRTALCTADNFRVDSAGVEVHALRVNGASVEVEVGDDLALVEACGELFTCATELHGALNCGDCLAVSFEPLDAVKELHAFESAGECDGGFTLATIAGLTPAIVLIGQRLAAAGIDPGSPGVFTVTTIS